MVSKYINNIINNCEQIYEHFILRDYKIENNKGFTWKYLKKRYTTILIEWILLRLNDMGQFLK